MTDKQRIGELDAQCSFLLRRVLELEGRADDKERAAEIITEMLEATTR